MVNGQKSLLIHEVIKILNPCLKFDDNITHIADVNIPNSVRNYFQTEDRLINHVYSKLKIYYKKLVKGFLHGPL